MPVMKGLKIMELRMSFNEDEYNYDKYRPEYPEDLFRDIISYSQINSESRLLEIGIGTGQATLPFIKLGSDVTAIELGNKLSLFVAEKYRNYDNFKVMNDDFMHCPVEENSLDLIYCATAFHWLPAEDAYMKIMKSLKRGGTAALFWNHPFPNRENDISNRANQRVYNKFKPSNKKQVEFCEDDCRIRVQELLRFGFEKVEYKLYRRVRTLQTDEYIQLLNTYSDHRALDERTKAQFEDEMRKAIDEAGGRINIYDTIDLYLGQKP